MSTSGDEYIDMLGQTEFDSLKIYSEHVKEGINISYVTIPPNSTLYRGEYRRTIRNTPVFYGPKSSCDTYTDSMTTSIKKAVTNSYTLVKPVNALVVTDGLVLYINDLINNTPISSLKTELMITLALLHLVFTYVGEDNIDIMDSAVFLRGLFKTKISGDNDDYDDNEFLIESIIKKYTPSDVENVFNMLSGYVVILDKYWDHVHPSRLSIRPFDKILVGLLKKHIPKYNGLIMLNTMYEQGSLCCFMNDLVSSPHTIVTDRFKCDPIESGMCVPSEISVFDGKDVFGSSSQLKWPTKRPKFSTLRPKQRGRI